MDDRENAAERQAKRKGTAYQARVKKEMRWSVWKQMKAEEMLKHLKSVVFPQLASLTDEASSFGIYMRGAECKINKPSLLVEAVNLIDQMEISQQNQDVQGDTSTLLSASLYEYLLSHLSIAGRTPSLPPPNSTGEIWIARLSCRIWGEVPKAEGVRAVVEPGRDIESLRGRMPPSGIISEAGRQALW